MQGRGKRPGGKDKRPGGNDMERKRALLRSCLFGVLFFSVHVIAEGQQYRRYQPNSPTVSPYLNLLRFNDGGLPNYYSLVRPQQQQRDVNVRGRTLIQRQQRRLDQVNAELQTRQTLEPTGKASWFMYPGKRQSFQNTSRYYPQVNVGR